MRSEVMKWIKTEEEQPDIGEKVLVYAERKRIFSEAYDWTISIAYKHNYDGWSDLTGMEIKPPPYWMSLPLPPFYIG